MYSQKGRNKAPDHNQSMREILVSNLTPMQQHQQGNQHKEVTPKRQFTRINMSLAQALQHMLKAMLIMLKDPLQNPNTFAPSYHPNERCTYHSDIPRHDTNGCWVLKNKIQDMIDAKEIEFDPLETQKVVTAPRPNH